MSHPKLAALAFIALATLAALSTPASAAGGLRTIPPACHADAARLCPGLAPGDHRFNRCMNQRKAEISTDCRAALKASRGKRLGKPAVRMPGR